jgi:hypothetical protein
MLVNAGDIVPKLVYANFDANPNTINTYAVHTIANDFQPPAI